MERYLVVIARDRPEVWLTWAAFYGSAGNVEVLVDRRQGKPWADRGDRPDHRARPNRESALQEHGFLVIPHPELAGTSH